jgi:hypothetical protein
VRLLSFKVLELCVPAPCPRVTSLGNSSKRTALSLWQKIFSKTDVKLEKEEILEAVYWLKQVIAVLTGLICAIVPFNGAIGFSLFVIHMVLFSHIFAFNYLKVDDNVVGGSMPVWTEGAFTALAFFLLVWITLYTILHDPELLSH